MTVREYIGARYVPLFMGEWSSDNAYEPLSIVSNQGNSYTARQAVPAGIPLSNESYWAMTGNYNAQIEQYRQEVEQYRARITAVENKFPIVSADIADNAVTVGKIATGAVETSDIADLAVTNAKIANGTIQKVKEATKWIACIGDSFGDADNEWATFLANKTGYNLINKCANGAGFISTSFSQRTFLIQLQEVLAHEKMTSGDIEYIVVYGGVNDWNNANASVSDMQTAINAFMDTYNSITINPKPKLIFAFGNCGFARQDRYIGYDEWVSQILTGINAGSNSNGIVYNVPYWLMCETSVFESDNLHPNAKGEKIIASYLADCISGTYNGVHKIITLETVENASSGKCVVHFDNGVSSVTGKLVNASIDFTDGQYFRVANFGSYCFSFGDGSAGTEVENMFIESPSYRIASNESGQIGLMKWVFNVKNGGLFLSVIGNKSSFNLTGNILTGSPDIRIGSGIGM